MRGYNTLKQLEALTPEQLKFALQFATGQMSMDLEGFTDSQERPEHAYAKYVFDILEDSIQRSLLPRTIMQHTSHPGKPTKAVYVDCPSCHDIATHMEQKDDKSWYCPNCGYSCHFDTPQSSIAEVYARAVGEVEEEEGEDQDCNHGATRPVFRTSPVVPQQEMIDGLKVSTDTLAYHLIPTIALQRLCERISLGEITKGKDAWNALSDNQEVLNSRKALARRFGHGINHAYRLLAKIQNKEEWTEEDEREASAFMWAGMFAICAISQQRKMQDEQD